MIVLIILGIFVLSSSEVVATLYLKDGVYSVKEGQLDFEHGIMFGEYKDSYEAVGWDFLSINSSTKTEIYSDDQIAYAYGYLEGYLTYKRIWEMHHIANYIVFQNITQQIPHSTVLFLQKQEEYIMNQPATDPYWKHAQDTYQFVGGIFDGYKVNSEADKQFSSIWEVYLVVSMGDLMDIMSKLPDSRDFLNPELLTENHRGKLVRNTMDNHCTGFVSYDPKSDDFYFAHVTWAWYEMNLRIFKKITLHYSNPLVKSKTAAFSSYPAMPISGDDFYVTDQNLFILETTLSCFNETLHELMTPISLLTWQRVLLANHFADNAEDWAYYFSLQNSGTYNDEFVILDGNLAKKRKFRTDNEGNQVLELPPKTVVAIDQIPKYMFNMDVTNYFIQIGNYFPGYNVPYNTEAYNLCEIPEYIKKNPSQAYMLDYNNCVRSLIFKRDHSKVVSVEEMKKLIRYNNYTTDPLSKNNPGYAISSRWDLRKENPQCGGGLDGKVVSLKEWIDQKKIHIISSPTYEDVPIFEFDKAEICSKTYHKDVVNRWDFEWIEVTVEV